HLTIQYFDVCNHVFKMNLQIIDSLLPEIMGEILLTYYSSKETELLKLVNSVSNKNPCNYDLTHNHNFYEYKVKNFLTDVALGLTPTVVWNGRHDATGGHIIVRQDGEIVCYHIYNRNEFQDYLFHNTKLDSPSTTRHQYGKLYRVKEQVF